MDTQERTLPGSAGRKRRVIYTEEMIRNARHNARTYDWAKKVTESVRRSADVYAEGLELLYDGLPAEGLPRSYRNSTLKAQDDVKCHCPACGADVDRLYGDYGFDPLKEPWKIWCPACGTRFPTNDFGLLYRRGLDETGRYSRELAVSNNRAAVARGEKDALVNEVCPERGRDWMVDDGFGWSPVLGTWGTKELVQYAPVAKYVHSFWFELKRNGMRKILLDLRDCYLYTGEKKYGRAGLCLLDRVADLYPAADITKVSLNYHLSHGGGYSGKTAGAIRECLMAELYITCYDVFSDLPEDGEVIAFLSRKAQSMGLKNPKTSGSLIRRNLEDGLLREMIRGLKDAKIYGNFGLHQRVAAFVAVTLDSQPETDDLLQWLQHPSVIKRKTVTDPIFGQSYEGRCENTGGELVLKFVEGIDRDGFGGEIAIGYNNFWFKIAQVASVLKQYGGSLDLYENPRMRRMYDTFIHLTGGSGYSFLFGDGGNVGEGKMMTFPAEMIRGYQDLGDPTLARIFHRYVNGRLDGPEIGMFSDVEALSRDIRETVETYGEYRLESENLTGYGFGILRGGQVQQEYDTWMYYGRTLGSHAHQDMLHMGISAYGFDFTLDLGNPEFKGASSNRHEWIRNTIAHNTVSVDGQGQKPAYTGTPLHFDSTPRVKVIDTECPAVYDQTEIYRRTLVAVAVDDTVSYTLDLFRVKGGSRHTYSLHSQSYMGYRTEGLELVPQVDEKGDYVGTYAGAEVPYGPDPNSTDTHFSPEPKYIRGYTWLKNVNRGQTADEDGTFRVDFAQTNFQKRQIDAAGLHLRYHSLNDWKPDSVDFVTGYPPRRKENAGIPGLDYMFIHRTGENPDTLFAGILEPYRNESYIREAVSLPVSVKAGEEAPADRVKAVKVVLKTGRTDYVIWATNGDVTYTVTDGEVSFDFRGFLGVYAVDARGKAEFTYANESSLIGHWQGRAAYTGTVVDFTKELSPENDILVCPEQEIEDPSCLAGRYVYVDNDARCNGAFRILRAAPEGENIRLSLGNCSLAEDYIDHYAPEKGLVYTVREGQRWRIPMSCDA